MRTDITSVYRFDDIEGPLAAATSRRQLLARKDFSAALALKLEAMLPEENGILSIDIFDTLLIRDNSSEITRFVGIGGRMADIVNAAAGKAGKKTERKPPVVSAIDAFLARYLGTKASYRASKPVKGCREGSLSEIHATASRLLTGSPRLSEAFIEAELAYEATRMKPNRLLVDMVKRHKKNTGRVVLLTDMYMHASQVETLMRKLRIDRKLFDLIVSSADTKVSKASGGVFAIVEKALKAEPEQFVHVGDSLKGDFQRPIQRGWQAVHLPVPEAEIVMRRKDHLKTASMLAKTHGIAVDIAMPR
jgi:FMN phosphatase YigB (HAD superfamily)